MRMHNPPHPGEVLRDYLGGVSITDAAKHLGVTRAALSRILNGSAGISAEMALRLSEALGTSAELWIGMQAQYDLWQTSKRRRVVTNFRNLFLGLRTDSHDQLELDQARGLERSEVPTRFSQPQMAGQVSRITVPL